MVNNKGHIGILHITTDESIDYIYDLALDEGLNKKSLAELKNKVQGTILFCI